MDWQGALLVRARTGEAKTYWENAPQGTARPYVTLLDVTELRPQTLKDWDLEAARVQVDVWADSYASKQTITAAVLGAIVPGGTSSGHTFQRADIVLGPRDIPERDGEVIIFRKSTDLIIHHTEELTT